MKGWCGGEVPSPVYNDILCMMVVHLLCLIKVLSLVNVFFIHFTSVIWFLFLCHLKMFIFLTLAFFRSKVSIIKMMEVNILPYYPSYKHICL